MKKIVVAIDSFKGCLSTLEAGEAAKKGIVSVFPNCDVVVLPVADGGEGVLDVLVKYLGGKYTVLKAHNPLMELIETHYATSADGKTALIEMATISGLTLIPTAGRNPMLTTSYGTGELIKHGLEQGCRNFIVCIGGSATNDAGLGMLQALGFRFRDKNNNDLGMGGKVMGEVESVDMLGAHPALKEASFTVVCDVNNPFCGANGAAHVFAKQKGANNVMISDLDAGMQHLAKVIEKTTSKDIVNLPGAGAAGGIGGAFVAFTNATLKPGIELLLDVMDFDTQMQNADLIITGEGKADRQTTMGKAPFGILQRAKKQNIPVIMVAGSIEDIELINEAGFKAVFSTNPYPVSIEKAMEPDFAKQNITQVLSQISKILIS